MIGKSYKLIGQGIQISQGFLSFIRPAMFQHPFDDGICSLAVMVDFREVFFDITKYFRD